MTILFYVTTTLFIIVCVFLILLVLIQKGRGGGLSSAFGGAGGNTAFGSKTGDVLTWATAIVFGVFLLLAVALNLIADRRNAQQQALDQQRMSRNQEAPLTLPGTGVPSAGSTAPDAPVQAPETPAAPTPALPEGPVAPAMQP